MAEQIEATFTERSAERIARSVKATERDNYVPKTNAGESSKKITNICRHCEVVDVYNSTRKMYPARFIVATLNGSQQLVWDFATDNPQDCWLDAGSRPNLSSDRPSRVLAMLVVIGDGELPVYYAMPGGEGTTDGLVSDVQCVNGELVVTYTG